MLAIADEDIGGGRVRMLFQGGKYRAGMQLTADEVLGMKNKAALIEQGYIEIYPKAPIEDVGDCHIVHLGGGKYDVIKGRRLNEDGPLTKDEAEDLATRPG
jgi:hypothetical protein